MKNKEKHEKPFEIAERFMKLVNGDTKRILRFRETYDIIHHRWLRR